MAGRLIQVAPHVWLFPRDPNPARIQPTVVAIVSATRTILVDAGNGARHARRIAAALEAVAAPPIRAIIYTHHHWDHVFGASVFEVPAIAHERCRDLLREVAAKPWGEQFLRDEIARDRLLEPGYSALARATDDWSDFAVVVPSVTFSQRLRLQCDEVSIELEHVGGQHAADSIVVRVPEARVLFRGDCFYPPPLYQRARRQPGSGDAGALPGGGRQRPLCRGT